MIRTPRAAMARRLAILKVDEDTKIEGMEKYQKTAPTLAVQMDEPFEVETLEGTMKGKAGDWLAQGPEGERWPIDKAIFQKTHQKVEGKKAAWRPAEGDYVQLREPDGIYTVGSRQVYGVHGDVVTIGTINFNGGHGRTIDMPVSELVPSVPTARDLLGYDYGNVAKDMLLRVQRGEDLDKVMRRTVRLRGVSQHVLDLIRQVATGKVKLASNGADADPAPVVRRIRHIILAMGAAITGSDLRRVAGGWKLYLSVDSPRAPKLDSTVSLDSGAYAFGRDFDKTVNEYGLADDVRAALAALFRAFTNRGLSGAGGLGPDAAPIKSVKVRAYDHAQGRERTFTILGA